MRIAVIGAGSWGTTLAALAARTNPVVLWARRPELAEAINAGGVNPEYVSGLRLPYGLRATSDAVEAVEGADAVVMAVPSHGFRQVLGETADAIADTVPILSLTKGIEEGSLRRMTEVIAETLPTRDPANSGVLTGPNLAQEIAGGHPAAAVIGMADTMT
ncbi:MAG: NAD(P)-binding domain-containing protein, partial [Acidimicrobiia bacterium]|nr:NAD(P)-binding domain-containing protein [Acidimicrobiia bacterium]